MVRQLSYNFLNFLFIIIVIKLANTLTRKALEKPLSFWNLRVKLPSSCWSKNS